MTITEDQFFAIMQSKAEEGAATIRDFILRVDEDELAGWLIAKIEEFNEATEEDAILSGACLLLGAMTAWLQVRNM